MPERLRVLAGDCTVTTDGDRDEEYRGYVVCVCKPDNTVLVHDADGYQPVAWLTRPESLTVESEGDAFALTASDGESRLRVRSAVPTGRREFPVGPAGPPVGDCPDCGGALARVRGDVRCVDCDARYGLPAGATVLDDVCGDCGLPLMRVARGERFTLCVDRGCESLTAAVREAMDGAYDCPDCGGPLRVRSPDGRTFLGCERYPDCETSFSIPAGEVVDDCDCGLAVLETATGRRCLDGTCESF